MQPEFQEPVRDAQAVFRAILRAFAYPAGPVPCPVLPASPHAALSPALAAVCMTLMDQDTPLWLSPSLRQDDVVPGSGFTAACASRTDRRRPSSPCQLRLTGFPPLIPSARAIPVTLTARPPSCSEA